jgi:ribosome-interacting GTPase 1
VRLVAQTLAKQLQYAAVWGTSSKHYPQRCGSSHVLEDEDVVQVRARPFAA